MATFLVYLRAEAHGETLTVRVSDHRPDARPGKLLKAARDIASHFGPLEAVRIDRVFLDPCYAYWTPEKETNQ